MDTFHTPTRGWLSGRLKGRQWLLLGMFLLFYVGLMFGPGSMLIHDYQLRYDTVCEEEANLSHLNKAEQKDSFIGLP